ncbi:MAG: septum formation initiator family protein [bacterium]|nr:septum formation initiator family protein [bacterium]MCY3924474.1 septum formation initiator family protein [bacterium]
MSRPQPSPSSAPKSRGESALRVVAPARAEPVRLGRAGLAVLAVLVAGLFVIGVLQAVVTEAQGRIDQLDEQIVEATATDRELRLRRAQLLSPAFLGAEARDRLGMVTPTTIVYLVPPQAPVP